jgi:hypothetical protein
MEVFSLLIMKLARQEPGVSSRFHAINLHEPFRLPVHHQTGVWCFMRLNNILSISRLFISIGL